MYVLSRRLKQSVLLVGSLIKSGSEFLAVDQSHHLAAARRCRGFAAVGPAGRRYRSIAAAAERRSSTAFCSKCEQCRVVSWRRKLNTDLVMTLLLLLLLLLLYTERDDVAHAGGVQRTRLGSESARSTRRKRRRAEHRTLIRRCLYRATLC